MAFYIFATIALFASLMVVTGKSVVHSALFLILLFFSMAGLFITLEADFLAGLEIFVYAGGIMVMFVFVVMIINIPKSEREPQFTKQRYVGLIAIILLFVEVMYLISQTTFKGTRIVYIPEKIAKISNTTALGQLLFNEYLFTFEIASLVLLVAMIGAITLSSRRVRQRIKSKASGNILNKM